MKNRLRKTIYIILGLLSKLTLRKVNAFVLCYHGFSNDNWKFSTTTSSFKKQILALKKTHTFVSAPEFESYLSTNFFAEKPLVLLTIDDGYKDIMSVREFLNRQNIKPTVFLLSNARDVNRKELDNHKELLSIKDIRILQRDGWFFGSHGATHSDFYKLSREDIAYEVTGSKQDLEKVLGCSVDYFAYPKGRYTKEILTVVKKSGYKMAFSMDDNLISQKTKELTIPRIGIDGTHAFSEFKNLTSFYAIIFRRTIKKYLPSLAI